jgi:hypothetical protein
MMMAAAVIAAIRPPKGNDTGFIYPEMSRGREFSVAELFLHFPPLHPIMFLFLSLHRLARS